MKKPRLGILICFLAFMAIAPCANAEGPDRVHPSAGTVGKLRSASVEVADTIGEHLDAGHDWVYRRLQHLFEDIDIRFARPGDAPIVVPLSPLRIGLDSELLHRRNGFEFAVSPDIEASVLLPNIERRFKLFVSSTDLQESPKDSTAEHNPARVGARFAPRTHLDFELGVRAKASPSAFAAIRWTPQFQAGPVRVNPFAKTYVESGLGLGASGGIAFEGWRNRWIARSASYANWVRDTSDIDWTQSLIVGYARAIIQERRYDTMATGRDLACGAAARISVSGDRASRTSLYEASLIAKRPLHGGWLFGYIEPLVRWERDSGWHPDAGVRVGFDALFWGLASLPSEVASYCR